MNFAIISNIKAGGHFLAELLNSHPDIRCEGETFYRPKDKAERVFFAILCDHPPKVREEIFKP